MRSRTIATTRRTIKDFSTNLIRLAERRFKKIDVAGILKRMRRGADVEECASRQSDEKKNDCLAGPGMLRAFHRFDLHRDEFLKNQDNFRVRAQSRFDTMNRSFES